MKHFSRIKYTTIFAVVVLSAFFFSCANVGYPSGGEVDKTAPKATAFEPTNETKNFTSNNIVIHFDEYIQLKDVDNQVLISPPFEHKAEIVAKGKYVSIKIKDTLLPNTTYLFQFKNAIVDNNEGNALPSLDYVFSTGDHLDSLSVKGKVVDGLTLKPDENIAVLLYSEFTDSAIAKSHPVYMTKTDKNGVFKFKYLKQGLYKIIALKDDDRSLTYNNASEKMAFSTDTILPAYIIDSVDTADSGLILHTFLPEVGEQRITDSKMTKSGKAIITTLYPLVNATITSPENELITVLNKSCDTLEVWTTKPTDSLTLMIKDLSGIDDTLKLRYFKKKGRQGKENFYKTNAKATVPYFDSIKMTFTNPIDSVMDNGKIVCVQTKTDTFYTSLILDQARLHALVALKLQPDSSYTMLIPKGKIVDIYGTPNDSITLKTKANTPNDYGAITIKLVPATDTVQYIIQLLTEKDEVIAEKIYTGNALTFLNITAGKYKIRAILDVNANGQWETGNYWQHLQPEEVYYFPKTLELRNNWEIEETFDIESKK
ncbi:MAG: Ig-like domain-containing protein [Bacteroidales bacterium]|nr:Ig-like domain-containing protein [Bacteroidales bacterium]